MTQNEAASQLAAAGARYVSSVTRSTKLLVIGDSNWPLTPSGRISQKLHAARRLQRDGSDIGIIDEGEFLNRLCGEKHAHATRKRFSPAELVRLVPLTPLQVRSWISAGLIESIEDRAGVPYFDYRQVCRAKSLLEFQKRGVTLKRLRRSLQTIAHCLPVANGALELLSRLELQGSRLILESADGKLMEPNGQLVFGFDSEIDVAAVEFQRSETTDDLFSAAIRDEEAGQFRAAADAYRRLLELDGPDTEICFNLANTLVSLGEGVAASERYRQCVELDPEFVEAWHNLGNVLAASGEHEQAIDVFRRVIAMDPSYADAHYNLADTLDEMGRTAEARAHWEAFLEHEPTGEWAEYSRKRLAEFSA